MSVYVVPKLAAFAVDLEGKVVQRAPDEPVDDAVAVLLAPLEGAVGVGDPQDHEAQPALTPEDLEVALGRELVGSVDRDRTQSSGLAHRKWLVRSVDESGAWEYQARGRRKASACRQDVEQSPQVDIEILARGCIADSGARLSGEVKYEVRVGNGCVNDGLVSDVTPEDVDLG